MAVAFLMFFAFIEDPYKRMFIGIILGLLTWITGLCMHSFDKDSLEKKCKIAYELNDKNKRELAKEIVQHNNMSNIFYFELYKIDTEEYPDLKEAIACEAAEIEIQRLEDVFLKKIKSLIKGV
jgi:hypothetical protein